MLFGTPWLVDWAISWFWEGRGIVIITLNQIFDMFSLHTLHQVPQLQCQNKLTGLQALGTRLMQHHGAHQLHQQEQHMALERRISSSISPVEEPMDTALHLAQGACYAAWSSQKEEPRGVLSNNNDMRFQHSMELCISHALLSAVAMPALKVSAASTAIRIFKQNC